MNPRGCNRSHILKALGHLTSLPNLQPSQEPPAPSQMAQWKEKKYIYIYS